MRVRWLNLDIDESMLLTLERRMRQDWYRTGMSSGFQLHSSRADRLHGIFIQRLQTLQQVKDPDGLEFEQERIEYKTVTFILTLSRPSVELRNSSKVSDQLIKCWLEYLNHASAIEILKPDISIWLKQIGEFLGPLRATRLLLTNVSLSASTWASIDISGNEDVRRFAEPLGHSSGQIKRICLEGKVDNQPFKFELCSPATAKVSGPSQERVLNVLRTALSQV